MDWFAEKLLAWWLEHGRKDLPWQVNRTPYRVWISEIMLQQTQVTTVIPYFDRFLNRFPSISDLNMAKEDEVLALWTGLGYYNRAKHLHQTAKQLALEYDGEFPRTIKELQLLPGIGRSTAGAILSLGYGIHAPILDANVKRVLTRFHAISGLIGKSKTEKKMWSYAETHTPQEKSEYNQAIMDLGATLCLSRNPHCDVCPLTSRCAAAATGNPERYPRKPPPKKKPERHSKMFLLIDQTDRCLIEKRPPTGIWPSLWGPPERSIDTKLSVFMTHWGLSAKNIERQLTGPTLRHNFSHFRLLIEPVYVYFKVKKPIQLDQTLHRWHSQVLESELGLSTVAKKLLETIPHYQKPQ